MPTFDFSVDGTVTAQNREAALRLVRRRLLNGTQAFNTTGVHIDDVKDEDLQESDV